MGQSKGYIDVPLTPKQQQPAAAVTYEDVPLQAASPAEPSLPKRFLDRVNPIAAAQAMGRMMIPEVAARALGADDAHAKEYGPINTLQNMGAATQDVFEQAKKAYDEGDYGSAAIKAFFGSIPMLGPDFNQMGDNARKGEWGKALTDAAGLGTSIVAPAVIPKVTARVGKALPAARTAEEAAAVQFGRDRGVPIDAATATGNRYVQGVQAMADTSPLGSFVAGKAKNVQQQSMRHVAGELKDEASSIAADPVVAGERVKSAVEKKIVKHHADANDAYTRLRTLETNAVPEDVPVRSAPVSADPKALDRNFILRWLADDMRELPFQAASRMRGQHAIDAMEAATSQEAGRRSIYSPRVAGSPVQDTLNLVGLTGTKAELANRLDKAIQSGKLDPRMSKVADAYLEAWDGKRFDFARVSDATMVELGIRRKSMQSPLTTPDPAEPGASRFFPESSDPEVPRPVAMEAQRFSMDLRDAKNDLRPIYDRLKREAELVPLQGGKASALTALDRLLSGPDYAPLSIVDEALGDLKSLSRNNDLPELRTQGQGVAALAVKKLDGQLRARAEQLGPDVLQALEEGRAATTAKYATAEVRDILLGKGAIDEPRAIFNRLTSNDDAGISKLRELQKVAPDEVPNVARALLTDILETPMADGGFSHGQKALADWQRLGTSSKRLLFPKPGQVQSLDNFFLLAKKLSENPNPSGTSLVANSTGQTVLAFTNPATGIPIVLGSAALSKMLHSTRAVKFLTTGLRMSINAKPAAQAAAVAQIARAAKESGVVIPFPKAAEAEKEQQ